jgi:RimJ/RimL family protein N-acetyltransferase
VTPLPADVDLTDGVVSLRRWQPDDAPVLTEIWQDAELQRRFGVETPVTRDSIDGYLAGVAVRWAAGAQLSVAIVAGGEVVGGCDLDDLDTDEPDLGYWVAAPARRRGHATRAARLLLDWAVQNVDASKILLVVEPDNVASIAVATALGFRRVPDRHEVEDDRLLDVYELPITR